MIQARYPSLRAETVRALLVHSAEWTELPHLGRLERAAPYSLVVSIETEDQAVDLYTPITAQTSIPVQVVTDGR